MQEVKDIMAAGGDVSRQLFLCNKCSVGHCHRCGAQLVVDPQRVNKKGRHLSVSRCQECGAAAIPVDALVSASDTRQAQVLVQQAKQARRQPQQAQRGASSPAVAAKSGVRTTHRRQIAFELPARRARGIALQPQLPSGPIAGVA